MLKIAPGRNRKNFSLKDVMLLVIFAYILSGTEDVLSEEMHMVLLDRWVKLAISTNGNSLPDEIKLKEVALRINKEG